MPEMPLWGGEVAQHKYRIEAGTFSLGLVALAAAGWLFFWIGWKFAVFTGIPALVILYLSVGHHPETESHTGPFARCGHTPPDSWERVGKGRHAR